MNMLLKQQLKTISEDIREIDYSYNLTEDKIDLQRKYINDMFIHKEKLINEKTILISCNE